MLATACEDTRRSITRKKNIKCTLLFSAARRARVVAAAAIEGHLVSCAEKQC
jgi:hypothetical protein